MCPSVKSAKDEWNTRAAPELPDGYRVDEVYGGEPCLWHGEQMIAYLSLGKVQTCAETKHWPALAAFLQGAR